MMDIAMTDKNKYGTKQHLIFSDAQIEFIEKHQKTLDIEFTEEEKNFCFISGKVIKPWKRLEVLSEEELKIGQTRQKKFKVSQVDIDNFKL